MKQDLVIPAASLEPIDDYDTDEVAFFFRNVMPAMIVLFQEKDKNYNGSWQRRGIMSAQANFERKVDRISAQFYSGAIMKASNENISDTFIDNSIYSLMYLFYLYSKSPEVKAQVDEFIEKYKPTT